MTFLSVNMEPESSIRGLFASARAQRKDLDSSPDPTASLYQENLQAAIANLEECRRLAESISLFSPNEAEDDVASGDLQYLQRLHLPPMTLTLIAP